jgi:hypothetical protein
MLEDAKKEIVVLNSLMTKIKDIFNFARKSWDDYSSLLKIPNCRKKKKESCFRIF